MNRDELENKWREEFKQYLYDSYDFLDRSQDTTRWDEMEDNYLQACKARQKELDEALELLNKISRLGKRYSEHDLCRSSFLTRFEDWNKEFLAKVKRG